MLIDQVVGIGMQLVLVPLVTPLSLAGPGGAKSLIGYVGAWGENCATGDATSACSHNLLRETDRGWR